MENQLHDETENVPSLSMNEEIQYYLYETAKWAKFLSIVGFVFIGFILLVAIAAGSVFSVMEKMNPAYSTIPGGASFISIIYVLMALLYFFPTLYLYRFSANAKQGINYANESQLTEAFSNLKSVFKFWGILTLVIIIFYTLVLIAIIAGVGFMQAMR